MAILANLANLATAKIFGGAEVNETGEESRERRDQILAVGLAVAGTVNPAELSQALSAVYQGAMGIVAAASGIVAQQVALGVSVGNHMRKPMALLATPSLARIFPEAARDWISSCVNYVCKAIGTLLAFMVGWYVFAMQSSVYGGLLFSRRLLKMLKAYGAAALQEYNPQTSYLDEAVGWGVAFVGFIFQGWVSWRLPFPLNIILLPLLLMERILLALGVATGAAAPS